MSFDIDCLAGLGFHRVVKFDSVFSKFNDFEFYLKQGTLDHLIMCKA